MTAIVFDLYIFAVEFSLAKSTEMCIIYKVSFFFGGNIIPKVEDIL